MKAENRNMNMKRISTVTVVFGLWAASAGALAGEKVGNGGGAWVCRENSGTIRNNQLVDLFEAEHEFSLVQAQYAGTLKEVLAQVDERLGKASKTFQKSLKPYLQQVALLKPKAGKIIYVDQLLAVVDDALFRVMPHPKSCANGRIEYEQVVNYKEDGAILVQGEVIAALKPVHQAALIYHEAIYAYRRSSKGDENSVITRRITGLLFSKMTEAELRLALESFGEFDLDISGSSPVLKFVAIKPGSFLMGSPTTETGRLPNEIRHPVTITKAFEMQNTEVTQAQWVKVMKNNLSVYRNPENCPETYTIIEGVGLCPLMPVDGVSWNDAQVLLGKLNSINVSDGYLYRLPTEAEWEYAARAGTQTAYSFGDNASVLRKYGWFNEGKSTRNVGMLKPNAWGLYDMHGNIAEWVQDGYAGFTTAGAIDPVGTQSGFYHRVVRGGSWDSSEALSLRSAARFGAYQSHGYWNIGFRLVRTKR